MSVRNESFVSADTQAALVARLDAWLAQDVARHDTGRSALSVEPPVPMLDLEAEIYTDAWSALLPETAAHLDRLRKKIEVARMLRRYYLPDLSQAAAAPLLGAAAVRRLYVLLLKASVVWRDARYLNAVLKLNDAILGRDDCSIPNELRALARATLDALVPWERSRA